MISFRARIQKGVEGNYSGLENGFKLLNKIIYRVQRGLYYLIGGLSGSGKSKLVNFMLLNAIQDAAYKGITCHVFYYSFEIGESVMKANMLSAHLSKKYNVVISPEKINGFGDNRLSPEELVLVDQEIDFIEGLFSNIHFRYNPMHPTAIFMDLFKFAESIGKFTYTYFTDSNGKECQTVKEWVANDPEAYVLVVMDHIALLADEEKLDLKAKIDRMSKHFVWLRNICGYTFFILSQFNSALNSVERQKFKGVDLSPGQSDFKDSGNPYQDCDIAMGIFNPWKLDIKESDRYDLKILQSCYRQLKVIKSRISYDNITIGTVFNPKSENFIELPPAETMTPQMYADYRSKVS